MSTLSANTLFHFTKSKDNLIDILKSNFRPSYCTEKTYFTDKYSTWNIPMVCFCDIPLSQIKEHTSWYGEYAIGITKKWAIQHNVNPLQYINDNIELVNIIKENFKFLLDLRDKENCINSNIQPYITNLFYQCAYIKPYEGEQYNHKQQQTKTKRFYDEREWRYIPSIDKFPEPNSMFCFGNDSSIKGGFNSYITDELGLNFEPKYINYIIVSKESEILEIKREVERIKGNYSRNDVEQLTTRIISMERIKEDF